MGLGCWLGERVGGEGRGGLQAKLLGWTPGSALISSKILSTVTLYSHFNRALTFENFVLAKLLGWTPASAALAALQNF